MGCGKVGPAEVEPESELNWMLLLLSARWAFGGLTLQASASSSPE